MLDSVYAWSVRESAGIHNQKLQMQASASKLQQLPWPTAFEDLRLLLRSADAPGLSP